MHVKHDEYLDIAEELNNRLGYEEYTGTEHGLKSSTAGSSTAVTRQDSREIRAMGYNILSVKKNPHNWVIELVK